MLGRSGSIQLTFRLAHARRKFTDVYKKTKSPISADIIARIARVYAIEVCVRGRSVDTRRAARQAESVDVMAAIKAVLETTLPQLSTKLALAKAIRFTLAHW
jgi:transposase